MAVILNLAQTFYIMFMINSPKMSSLENKTKKSYRCPKFDGDVKQTLEIQVKRKRNSHGRNKKKEERKKNPAAAGNRTRDLLISHF